MERQNKKNLWMYPLGTVGRDMMYSLFTSFILTYILLTRSLTDAQLLAITGIMIGARFFDAANDPIMGLIIERTRTRFGKFKPWFVLGMITTTGVIIAVFNATIQGWGFVVFFGIIYFLFSITYTMHDISYWGMIPALTEDAALRNQMVSRATLFAGIGNGLAGMLIPMFTVGSSALADSAQESYGIVSIAICVIALAFGCFTTFGAEELHVATKESMPLKHKSLKEIFKTIVQNKPLLWVLLAFVCQQIGNAFVVGGIGSTYVYFQYGYSGGYYSIFSTIGLVASGVLMIIYPMLTKKAGRKSLMKTMLIAGIAGTVLMLLSALLPKASMFALIVLTLGNMLSNFGLYGFYLVMMISILNTVEYNEYMTGERDEAIISSVRPFVTKLASGIVVGLTSLSYLIFRVTDYTNQISDFESQASAGAITEEVKLQGIESVIASVSNGQTTGLLFVMALLPITMLTLSYILYVKHYTLDEAEYDRICVELQKRKEQ